MWSLLPVFPPVNLNSTNSNCSCYSLEGSAGNVKAQTRASHQSQINPTEVNQWSSEVHTAGTGFTATDTAESSRFQSHITYLLGSFKNHKGGQMVVQTAQEGHGASSLEVLRTGLDKILGSPVADPALSMGLD